MRKLMLLLAVLGLVGTLFAADPLLGTWKLNAAKSKFSPILLALEKDVAPKETTMVIQNLDNERIEITETGTRIDGSTVSQKFRQPRQGGTVESSLAKGISFIHTVISESERVATILQDGKQSQMIHWVVSQDGKNLMSTRRVLDAQGKPVEHIAVYDRQ
jgi:hypothetical protein